MNMFNFLYRACNKLLNMGSLTLSQNISKIIFHLNNISFGKGLISNGVPRIYIHRTGNMEVGSNFKINNTIDANPIGRSDKCMFVIRENATLKIGNYVGMSGTIIVCQKEIEIGDHVKIGGNVCIYDTDFHSLDTLTRSNPDEDKKATVRKNVRIGNHVFIGAHTTILKGVTIGDNSVIGACSVITKSIPSNQIWAGNPAQFIRELHDNQ